MSVYDDDNDDGRDNGDENEDCSPLEQLQKIEDTTDELQGQLVELRDLLAPTDAAPGPLASFLTRLETNSGLQQAWKENPDADIDASSLPAEDKAALRTGGIDAVNQRLAAEGSPNAVAWIRIWVRP